MKHFVKHIVMTLLVACASFCATAQELNCQVEVNTQKVENVNKDTFITLQNAIADYMNTTKWTDAQFSVNEKIECRLFITVDEYVDQNVTAELQIQSSRPVYNSVYTTTLINFKDTKVKFNYQENEPLVYTEQNADNNLTAILNYYAFMILAIDFDSFSPQGGTPYYEKAANVVRMAQSVGEAGWKAFEDTKNRAAVLSAFYDNNTSAIRDLLYLYHRKGLDEMSVSPDKGRATITESLQNLTKVYQVAPMSVCLTMFKDAKMDELVNVYSKAGTTEKEKVYELLYQLYPTETQRLNKIKEPAKR